MSKLRSASLTAILVAALAIPALGSSAARPLASPKAPPGPQPTSTPRPVPGIGLPDNPAWEIRAPAVIAGQLEVLGTDGPRGGRVARHALLNALDDRDTPGIVVRNPDLLGAAYDVTILAEAPKIAPNRDAMRQRIAEICALDVGAVAVKATTNEGLGFIGRGEGIAATAVATIRLPMTSPS